MTIKDIARAAGVSHTTVSRALKDSPVISAETREYVQQLARDMGYVPNSVAQNLQTQKTQTIGMVVTTIADPFIISVVEGVENIAQQAGYSVFLSTSHNDSTREIEVVRTFQRRRVDAILVASSRVGSLYSSALDQTRVPIVLINNQAEGKYLYALTVDDEAGTRQATEYLLSLGHQRIGYVGAADRPRSNRHRLQGYLAAMRQFAAEPDPGLIITPDTPHDLARGAQAFDYFQPRAVTAIVCYNDVTAIGLLNQCHQRGRPVPQSLSIIGFDDIEAATYTYPALTTVRQPRRQLGEEAMTMALALLDGHPSQDKRLPCELVVRQSTNPPPLTTPGQPA